MAHSASFRISSCFGNVDAICMDVRAMLGKCGLARHVFAVNLLLREFINNAILHGNHLDADKRVFITVRIGLVWIVLKVADEGSGFDWRQRRLVPPASTDISGRGLAIGELYATRMRFNRTGNKVTLWIRKGDHKE